jgi:hypothetical protein
MSGPIMGLRLRALFHKEKLEARMDEEMPSHIEMQTQENMAKSSNKQKNFSADFGCRRVFNNK